MKFLWNKIDQLNRTEREKAIIFLLCDTPVFALIGLSVWGIVQLWCLKTWDWMLCFMGYSVIGSYITAFLYSCRLSFHNGACVQNSAKVYYRKRSCKVVAAAHPD